MAVLGWSASDMASKKILSADPKTQPFDMDIIKLIEEYLTKNPMTMVQLGKNMKVSYPTLLDFLKGKRKPNAKTKAQMIKFLKEQKVELSEQ